MAAALHRAARRRHPALDPSTTWAAASRRPSRRPPAIPTPSGWRSASATPEATSPSISSRARRDALHRTLRAASPAKGIALGTEMTIECCVPLTHLNSPEDPDGTFPPPGPPTAPARRCDRRAHDRPEPGPVRTACCPGGAEEDPSRRQDRRPRGQTGPAVLDQEAGPQGQRAIKV